MFAKFLNCESVVLKQDQNETTVVIFSKTLNALIQEIINMQVER